LHKASFPMITATATATATAAAAAIAAIAMLKYRIRTHGAHITHMSTFYKCLMRVLSCHPTYSNVSKEGEPLQSQRWVLVRTASPQTSVRFGSEAMGSVSSRRFGTPSGTAFGSGIWCFEFCTHSNTKMKQFY
jgi:hypothetical protein